MNVASIRSRTPPGTGVLVGVAIAIGALAWAGIRRDLPDGMTVGSGIGLAGIVVLGVAVLLGRPAMAVVVLLFATFLRLALDWSLPVAVTSLCLAMLLAGTVLAVWRRQVQMPRLGALELLMALYLACNVWSAVVPNPLPAGAPDVDGTGEFSVPRFILGAVVVPFGLFLAGRVLYRREADVRRLLWAVVAMGGYSAWVSIMQYNGPPALVWPKYILTTEFDDRAVGVFNQPNENGITLTIGFLVAVHLLRQRDTGRVGKIVAAAVVLASPYAVYLTHTRVVWLAFAVVVVLGALISRSARPWFLAVILAATLTVGLNWSNFTSTDREAGGVGETSQIEERLNGIATSVNAIEARPLLGWGVGRFPAVNTLHHEQFSQDVRWSMGFGIVSHQNELGIATELGLTGLACWLGVVALLLRRQVIALRLLPDDGVCGRGLAVAVLLGFVMWALCGIADDLRFFDFENSLVMLLAGVVVGVVERRWAAGHAIPTEAERPVDEVAQV
ncbi:O-antigen ligase [Pseudonocardia sediminis]|uniref:O-antigen ligase n=1 Tax=Pseudonocardia sediminis TaxID=1397368 RepID=A0A4Q7V541_PSEST|nr:O-antigen ligase family protein [Pseudonocardia sediminis]RZT87883.1 O-antigen ligase [Pseudonocardia sediminis]